MKHIKDFRSTFILLESEKPVVDKMGNKTWKLPNGLIHRIDGPAVENVDGTKEWWLWGSKYDIDEYYDNIYVRSDKEKKNEQILDRLKLDGFLVKHHQYPDLEIMTLDGHWGSYEDLKFIVNGSGFSEELNIIFLKNTHLHRVDGPAHIHIVNLNPTFYLEGIKMTQKEYESKTNTFYDPETLTSYPKK